MSLVLKNRVKKRSTFTLGDSYSAKNAKNFNEQSPAVPGRFGTMSRSKILAADSENFANEFRFVEAQIFGGLPFSDIKKIIVKNPELIPILQSKLAEAGIKIPVGTSKLSFIGKLNQMFYKNKTYKHNGEDTGLSMFLPQYKNGGMVMGSGSGTSDSIPAMVSNGEYVVNAKATKQNLSILDAINNNKVAKFAGGGLAGSIKKSLYGGAQRMLAPLTMQLPGNKAGGFGMSQEALGSQGFVDSLRNALANFTLIEEGTRRTQKALQSMEQPATEAAIKITKALRQTENEMKQSGKAATHISEIFDKAQPQLQKIMNDLQNMPDDWDETSSSWPFSEEDVLGEDEVPDFKQE
jgi:hypothetical protein